MPVIDSDTSEGHPQGRYLRSARDLAVDELPVLPGVVVRLMSLTPESEQFFEEVLVVASEEGRVCAHWDVPDPILTIVKNHHQQLADAVQRDLPELELPTIGIELAKLLPTVRAASNQAAQHLGLRTH